jgi:hypothetical protein
MKKNIVVALLLGSVIPVAFAQGGEGTDFINMERILRVATQDLPGKNYRVIFATEGNRESPHLRHWIATVQEYPVNYKPIDNSSIGIVFSGPPCAAGKVAEVCSISEVPGPTLFHGRFDVDDAKGHFRRFEGNIDSTASKMLAFNKQLSTHQQWTQAEIATALAAAGAKFGPDKEKEFRATLPDSLKMLEKAFGPMRVNKVLSMKPHFLTLASKEHSLFGWPAYWSVSTILLRNPKERLVMYFDPFEGQLQSLFVSQGNTILDPKTHKPKWIPPND